MTETDESITHDKKQKSETSDNNEDKTIKSPMQGTIQKILVKQGKKVKHGDSLMILEAMKLENNITADKDYIINEILVNEGDTVDSNQPLIKVN